jgi:Carboxypeptidase C (cathepsin A)
MMDPVGTGLSRAWVKQRTVTFGELMRISNQISQFIRNYVNDNERWNSPKYLLGESYGTFRSAGVADYLQENIGISVNGIILVSNVLDIRQLHLTRDDLPFIVNFPTYALLPGFIINILINQRILMLS